MHSPDLNSLNHTDLSLEQIGHDTVNVDVMSNFLTEHGLNLNHQDCQTHNYHTDDGMNLDYGNHDMSYPSMADESLPSLYADTAMNLDYANHDVSYTSMVEASYPSLDAHTAMNVDYGNHDVSYTNMAEVSFNSVDSYSAMPRATTPNYEDASYHEGREKFNHEMAESWASGGYFDKAADYEKTAGYHHDKIGESLGS